MCRLLRSLTILVLGAGLMTSFPSGPASAIDAAERAEIEKIFRDYLLKNPEILLEAMQILRQREETAETKQRNQALVEYRGRIYEDPTSPVVGNPNGDVSVVEFFDYQCGYCKRVRNSLVSLLDEDRKVRLVLKEFPILGPASTLAARAALASRAQGKYWEFHNGLLDHRGRLSEESIMRIAGSVGLDTAKLKRDMGASEISAIIDANMRLAERLAIRGTPAFIIGEAIVPGAISLDELKRLVAAARGRS